MDIIVKTIKRTSIKDKFKNKKGELLKLGIILLIAVLIIYSLGKEVKGIDVEKTLYILKELDINSIFILIIMGSLSFVFTASYDFTVSRYFDFNLKLSKVIAIGWISNSINNITGMGGIGGAGIRTLLYTRSGVPFKKAVNANFYIILSTMTGLSTMILLGFLGIFNFSSLLGERRLYSVIMVLIVLYLPLYFLLNKMKFIKERVLRNHVEAHYRLKLFLYSASLGEWVSVSLFFAMIIGNLSPDLPVKSIMGVYFVSIALGLASFLPGAVGSFDFAALLGLKLIGAQYENALAGIILFRVFYYLVPWIVAMVLMAAAFLRKRLIKYNI